MCKVESAHRYFFFFLFIQTTPEMLSRALEGPKSVFLWFATVRRSVLASRGRFVGEKRKYDGTYMRGELGAVEVVLRAYVGVSVRSCKARKA